MCRSPISCPLLALEFVSEVVQVSIIQISLMNSPYIFTWVTPPFLLILSSHVVSQSLPDV